LDLHLALLRPFESTGQRNKEDSSTFAILRFGIVVLVERALDLVLDLLHVVSVVEGVLKET
jgi:hypothetical protein